MKTQLIAEIAQAHDGSLGILHSYIDALSGTGIHALKFQMHIADAESSIHEQFRIPFSYVDKSRYDYWKRMEFTLDQWKGIQAHCEDAGLEFLVSPFSVAAVNQLEKLNVKRYKVGSGNISDLLLIDKIASTNKPLILSSGMSDWNELETAIQLIRKYHHNITLMQCTTNYPCPPERLGLSLITEMKKRFELPVGFSDHSGKWYTSIAAVALDASIIEFHVSFDRRMFGPDASSSLTIDEVKLLSEAINFTEQSLSSSQLKNDNNSFRELKTLFGKSLAINKELKKSQIIQKDDLESKKPTGHGIPSDQFDKLIGKKLLRDISKHDFINWSDVE